MPVKRLVMIMGFQRSGTTALFNTLSTASGVSARHEHPDDEIYAQYELRPEVEIRPVLHSLPGTVLLKPVKESAKRSPLEVAEEFGDYDLTIVWLYRDPVNVYQSWQRKGWVKKVVPNGFGYHWVRRNARCLDSIAALGERLVIVRYEDLVSQPACVDALAERLGFVVRSTLQADSNAGRVHLPAEVQETIDGATRGMLARLDDARSIRPLA